jgi:hypothetical protein
MILFALNANELVHIRDTLTMPETTVYKCVDCQETLIPVRGSIVVWHFRHSSNTQCWLSMNHMNHTNESKWHALAKQYVAQTLSSWKFICMYRCSGGEFMYDTKYTTAVEYRTDDYVLDIGIFDSTKQTTLVAAVEICYTHRISTQKRQYLRTKLDIPVMEVNALDVLHCMTHHTRELDYSCCNKCEHSDVKLMKTQSDGNSENTPCIRKRKYARIKRRPCDYCGEWNDKHTSYSFESFNYYIQNDTRLIDTKTACRKTCILRCYQCRNKWVSLKWKKVMGPCWSCLHHDHPGIDLRVGVSCKTCGIEYDQSGRRFHFINMGRTKSPIALCDDHIQICTRCHSIQSPRHKCYTCKQYKRKWKHMIIRWFIGKDDVNINALQMARPPWIVVGKYEQIYIETRNTIQTITNDMNRGIQDKSTKHLLGVLLSYSRLIHLASALHVDGRLYLESILAKIAIHIQSSSVYREFSKNKSVNLVGVD